MINSPPHKKSRYEPTTVSSVSNTGNTMSNMNQQRTYKFSTNNTAQVKTSFNQTNNNNQAQAQRAPSNSGNYSNYGNSYGTNRMPPPPSSYNQPAAASTNHHHMSNKDVVVIDNNDEDLLDISDTELIRASQVVESQLKFTNNVHHTTSNALNIFSQFNQNANECAVGLMGPPMSTGATIYSNFSNANNNQDASQVDDLRNELKQIKSENMAKDGEVKILRDKLKRLEQETQRMRTERVDLVKKLQQQQDEAKKSLQKQIEYKELENQFKSQEIVELTMKYKVLESTVKKNPNMLTQNQTYQSPQLSQAVGGGSNITKPKSTPTKRTVTGQNASLSDTENDNPFMEVKRPCPSTNKQQQSPSVQLKSTTSLSTSGQVVRSHAPLTSNTNAVNQINPQKSEIKTEPSSSSKVPLAMTPNLCVKCESPITGVNPLPVVALKPSKQLTTAPASNLKRTRVLPTRSQVTHSNHQRTHDDDDDTKFYQVTDYFAETANYLATFNENVLKTQRSNTTPINLSLFMSRLGDLAAYTRVNLNSKLASSPLTIERIEFVTTRLSDELVKIVDYCLKATSNLNWIDSTPTDVNPVPRSSMNCKPFIDVLCAAYEINFNLFLYRFNHLLVGVALDVPLDSNKMTKINKLKESFYTVMFQLLESINFSSSSSSSSSSSVSNRSNAAKVINKSSSSSSHSSYSTLKILNCILDSFNRLLYLPCMYDTLESRDSPMAYYYACLVDGLHSYLKKFHLIYAPAHDEPPTHDVCLHQLFYEKLKKYFGEIVYSLELNENLTHPADADGSSNSSHGGQVSSLLPSTSATSMQPIITTIVDDMNESSIIKNFKLDDQQYNEQATDRLGTDVIEIPHSQADLTVNLDSNVENSKANVGGAMSTGVSSSFYTNNPYYVDIYNLNSIKLLKVEILVKFIYYLHNHQLFNSIENKLLKKCLNQRRAQTQPASLSTTASHNQKCTCYKDMLNSYLLLIDYILNEKFIFNGSKLSFDEYLLKLSTPKSTYLSRLFADVSCTDLFTDSTFSTINKSNLTMNLTEIFNLTNKSNSATTSTAATTTGEERLKKREKYENDQASFGCFMHVLIVSCFNSVLTLLDHFDDDVKKLDQQSTDNKMDTTNSDEDLAVSELLRARTLVRLERAKFYASIKYDHRLVNFYCLYRLVESTYDNAEDEHNAQQPSDRTNYARLFAHLRSSLSSLKNSFKAYIDDYLESI